MRRTFCSASRRCLRPLFFALLLAVLIAGCGGLARKPRPTPIPTLPAGVPPTQAAAPGGATAAAPAVVTATTGAAQAASTQANPGQATNVAVAAGVTETPDACPPPSGWVSHLVRQDETLYYLATSTNVSVDEVIKANCLASDLIQVGQRIYLPSTPPLRPTFPPAPPAPVRPALPEVTEVSCPSPFSCGIAGLPPLDLPAGMPGGPGFTPCQNVLGTPRISTDDDRKIAGERFYLFACDFKLPLASAKVKFPDGSEKDLPIVGTIPDFPENVAGRVVDFPILPSYAPTTDDKPLIFTIQGDDGATVSMPFFIDPFYLVENDKSRILVVPEVDTPGSADGFTIYYVNFPYQSTIDISVYGENNPVVRDTHHLSGRSTRKVTINQPMPGSPEKDGAPLKGWAVENIRSDASDKPAGYSIVYWINEVNQLSALFWLR